MRASGCAALALYTLPGLGVDGFGCGVWGTGCEELKASWFRVGGLGLAPIQTTQYPPILRTPTNLQHE